MAARLSQLPRPRRVGLVACVVAFIALALIGLGVGHRLHHSDVLVAGTPAAHEAALNQQAFGPTQDLVVLLEGPPSALRVEGPKAASRLMAAGPVRVLDPWNGGGAQLSPKPNQALLLVAVNAPFETVTNRTVDSLRRALRVSVRPPLRGYLSGYADIANAINTSTLNAITRAEIIAAPALLIVLLLVLGSPIAALVPLSLGGIVVAASQGVLSLINGLTPLDTLSLSVASMIGLALGVDYSLLLVTRFRSELAAGHTVADAVAVTVAQAGRTVRFAGAVLALVLCGTLLLYPGSILKSAVVGGLTAVAVSVTAATAAAPAVLQMLGSDINRWSLFAPGAQSQRWSALALRVLRRPVLAGGAVLVLLLVLGSPVIAMRTGPPDPRTLPARTEARTDFLHILGAVGGGRTAPFVITVVARQGTLADHRLATLAAFEKRLLRDRRTEAVLGPATIAARTAGLARAAERLPAGSAARARAGSARLVTGLGRASSGVHQLLAGLDQARAAAQSVASGSQQASGDTAGLSDGIQLATGGAQALQSGLSSAASGAGRLQSGASAANAGTRALSSGAATLDGGVRDALPQAELLARELSAGVTSLRAVQQPASTAEQNVRLALTALGSMLPASRLDPQYASAYHEVATALASLSGRNPETGAAVQAGYPGLTAALRNGISQANTAAAGVRQLQEGMGALATGLGRLQRGSRSLAAGLGQLRGGAAAMNAGLTQLLSGAGHLSRGLNRLSAGAGSLVSGLRQLSTGTGQLSTGLESGLGSAPPLEAGLVELQDGAKALQGGVAKLLAGTAHAAKLVPLLRSGYAVLAALDRAPTPLRNAASWAINLDHGGTGVQFLIVQRGIPTRRGNPYRQKLDRLAAALGRQIGASALVGGPAATLADFDQAAVGPLPRTVALLLLLTFAALSIVMRSPVLAAIAVLLNLLTVGAALGVLALAFGSGAPLGGPGYVDDLMVASAFTVIFALSIDYEIFLLDRMREGYGRSGSADGAIAYGLRHTAGVITGAAAIMTAVFAAFASSSSILLRELGVGLTVGVVLDATLVRLVLLPAALRLVGPVAWRWQKP